METTTTPAPFALDIDPRILLAAATKTAGEVIAALRVDQLDNPTPCPEFAVRDVLGHLVFVFDRVARMGRGDDPMTATDETDEVADDAWLAVFTGAAAEARLAWLDDAALDRTITLPWATDTGAAALLGYVSEITVHTWDIAHATGQSPEWDDEVVSRALALMKTWLPGAGRTEIFAEVHRKMGLDESLPGPFAEVVPVPAGAPLIDQLVAWNGRRP